MKSVFLLLAILAGTSLSQWVKQQENNGLFEGDIELRPDEKPGTENSYASIKGGRWPGGVVPYYIESSSRGNSQSIKNAIAQYHKHTCLKFKPRTNERGYISFFRGGGCSSPVGHRGSKNRISLGGGCYGLGTVMHEIGHSIGLYHEQSRPDRDSHVTILWNNIQSNMKFNFNKHSTRNIDSLGTPYDYASMMHYGAYAFGGRKMTIKTKDRSKQNIIGNRRGFSPMDIKQINLMYNCGGKPNTPSPPTGGCSGGDTDSKCGQWASQGYCTATDPKLLEIMKRKCCNACKTGECKNRNSRCVAWAKRSPSECQKNPHYMNPNCPKACGRCK